MGPLRESRLTILAAAGALGALWVVLPLRLPAAAAQSSIAECVTMADAPSTDLALLEKCHGLVPNDVELAADLAAAYDTAHRPADAIKIYQQILALDPLYADVRLRLAKLLRASGDDAGAKAQIDQALTVQPNRRALTDFAAGAKP
jgi:tetratricopeptide (TPR) repeat protein